LAVVTVPPEEVSTMGRHEPPEPVGALPSSAEVAEQHRELAELMNCGRPLDADEQLRF
jgi:hypothetical protein